MQTGDDGKRLGILVGGGPAPGINSAISAATIEAVNSGLEVIGIYDGFQNLAEGRTDAVRPLVIADVSRIHYQGGSILRTSRASPIESREHLERTLRALRELGISKLVSIGGDGTAFAVSEVLAAADGALRGAHIPKTIDNDLPLPTGRPTFGFETARHVGTDLVLNLMEDARTTNRWYFAVVMGRSTGHLALGIGRASGATLSVIPEEFPHDNISLTDLCNILEGAILKRRVMGSAHGVAVLAEGLGVKLDEREVAEAQGARVTHDAFGRIRLGDIALGSVLRSQVQKRFAARGDSVAINDVTLGYAIRGAHPIPFDVDYTRILGNLAVQFLLEEPAREELRLGGLVCVADGGMHVMSFRELRDSATGQSRIRMVDLQSHEYMVARKYMIRLEPRDFEDHAMRERLAGAARMTPTEFGKSFQSVVGLQGVQT